MCHTHSRNGSLVILQLRSMSGCSVPWWRGKNCLKNRTRGSFNLQLSPAHQLAVPPGSTRSTEKRRCSLSKRLKRRCRRCCHAAYRKSCGAYRKSHGADGMSLVEIHLQLEQLMRCSHSELFPFVQPDLKTAPLCLSIALSLFV